MPDNAHFMLPPPGKHLLSSSNVNMMNNIVMLPKKRHKFIPFSLAEYSDIIQEEDAMIISIENLMAYIDGHGTTLPPKVTPTVLRGTATGLYHAERVYRSRKPLCGMQQAHIL